MVVEITKHVVPYAMIWFKVGLDISRTNADSQWNPAYSALHRFFCCGNETIYLPYYYTQPVCVPTVLGALAVWRLSTKKKTSSANAERQKNYFPERISYMFLISKCRGDQDLGLCTTSVLAKREPQRNGKIRFFLCRNTFFFRKSPLRSGSPNASTEVVHRPRSQSPLHFDIRNI